MDVVWCPNVPLSHSGRCDPAHRRLLERVSQLDQLRLAALHPGEAHAEGAGPRVDQLRGLGSNPSGIGGPPVDSRRPNGTITVG